MNDCTISGSGSIGGGEYASVRCSGSAKINGNIKCESIRASGACHALGDIDCEHEAHFSGSFSCDGSTRAESLSCSGSCRLGSFSGGDISASGACRVNGDIKCKSLRASGSFRCAGSAECDRAELSGAFEINGSLNADESVLTLDRTCNSSVESIVGEKITVKKYGGGSDGSEISILGIIKIKRGGLSSSGRLASTLIEGDEISLVGTKAETVRGNNVFIGAGCDIGTVEYSGTLTTDGDPKIGKSVKIG